MVQESTRNIIPYHPILVGKDRHTNSVLDKRSRESIGVSFDTYLIILGQFLRRIYFATAEIQGTIISYKHGRDSREYKPNVNSTGHN